MTVLCQEGQVLRSQLFHIPVFNRETFCSAVKIIDFFPSESYGGNLGCPANQN